MANAALKGFLTRKEACEIHDISDRSIGRYLKKAMLKNDHAFLVNFKLATLEGEVTDGQDVSFELIDKLQADGRVPTWHVSSEWLTRKFKLRGDRNDPAVPETPKPIVQSESRGDTRTQNSKDEIIQILKQQVQSLQADKTRLEEEKTEMRSDSRETRKLMSQMQQLMGHMQDRLLPERASTPEPSPLTSTIVTDLHSQPSPKKATPKTSVPKQKTPARKQKKASFWKRDVRDLLFQR